MTFTVQTPLRFAHCDPAGIAYYPRYFEIVDAAVEDWTEVALGVSRAAMHRDMELGTPAVDLHASFAAISRHGDLLDVAIAVREVGRTSLTLAARVTSGGELRFEVTLKIVLMDMTSMKAVPWPDDWRARLEAMA
ncbi:MAG: thioesterase family protein [Pseudomonadota bacterium]